MATPVRRTAVSLDDQRYEELLWAILSLEADDPYPESADGVEESDLCLIEVPSGLNPIDPSTPDRDVDVHEQAVLNIMAADVGRLLRTLRARDRMVVYLRYGLGCDVQSTFATASLLRVTQSTVASVERRVLKELRLALGLGRINDEPECTAPEDDATMPPSSEPPAPSQAA